MLTNNSQHSLISFRSAKCTVSKILSRSDECCIPALIHWLCVRLPSSPQSKTKGFMIYHTCTWVLRPLKKASTCWRSWSVTWSLSSAVELLLLLLTSVAVSEPSRELTRRRFCCCPKGPWYQSYLLVRCRTAWSSAESSGRRFSSWGQDPNTSPPGFMVT